MTVAEDKFYRARITRRVDFSSELWMVRAEPSGEFTFSPGQYATLGVRGTHKVLERPYSIVSAPFETELEFFFELVPQGEVTPELYKLRVGDEMFMRKVPKGRFMLDRSRDRTNHLLVSTVTGVAPFVSYIRLLMREWHEQRFQGEHQLYLLNGASRSWEFGYLDELNQYAREVSWLKYVPTVSRPWDDADWSGEVGRVDDLVRKYSDMWNLDGGNTIAYLCGHPEMIENAKGILKRRGFAKEAVKEEVYWVPKKEVAAAS